MKISFNKATENDLLFVQKWIKANDRVKKWYYHDKVPTINTLRKKIIERQKVKDFYANIVFFNDIPVGYLQSYDVNGWGNWTKRVKIYENTVGLDYFIGENEYLNKGYGPKIIKQYIDEVVKKQKYDYATATPDPDNYASCRCLEKCGFKFQKVVNIPYINSKHREAIYLKKL